MQISAHPTVDELRRVLRDRGVDLACTVCGGEAFVSAEAAIRGAGQMQRYGAVQLQRLQLVCEKCSHVMSFEVSALQNEP